MDPIVEKELLEKVGKEATEATKAEMKKAEMEITAKANEFRNGLMSEKAFEDFKKEQMEPINAVLKTLEDASKEQGTKMNSILEKATPNTKSLEQFIEEKKDEIAQLRNSGGKYIEFTGAQLKAAGVYSISSTIPVASPYAPGVGGGPLEIFDIARNPNFIVSKIDLGRTNQSRLAWANEEDTIQGGATLVTEGGLKPQINHTFTIETSTAKKIAGWIELTDEFEQDLPNFATNVRRKLQEDVERAWDDAIQIEVQNAARPYEITGLNDEIQDANRWDAVMAMLGQVGFYNYIPNTVALNWLTNVMMQTSKATTDEYLLPPFAPMINNMLVYANKLQVGNALVGDLKQFHVDVYKDFMLKIGWINDEFIHNKFAIVGELRYHSYISAARKKAIVYASLSATANQIDGPGSF